jgi:HTH-type transcriptional regulator, transcriptional repressor of NAD biosynthesis genes
MSKRGRPFVVCFFGPESTGKTTMAGILAQKFGIIHVPEVSRELIDSNVFTAADIEKIGTAQLERMEAGRKEGGALMICDTDLITTGIYSQHYLGMTPQLISDLEKLQHIDLYYLFDIDVPWVADGLRDLGNHRGVMMDKFRNALIERRIPYKTVTGDYREREEFLTREFAELINSVGTPNGPSA